MQIDDVIKGITQNLRAKYIQDKILLPIGQPGFMTVYRQTYNGKGIFRAPQTLVISSDRVNWRAAEDNAAETYKRHNHEFVLRRVGDDIVRTHGVNKEFNRQEYLQRWYWNSADTGYVHIYLIIIENPELAKLKLLKDNANIVTDLTRKAQKRTKSDLMKSAQALELAIKSLYWV